MRLLVLLFAFVCAASAETLTIGAMTGTPGSTVRVPVTLSGSATAVALEIPFRYSKVVTITPVIGPAGTAAGKSIQCNIISSPGALVTVNKCLLYGLNITLIGNGIVAYLDVTLPLTFSGTAGLAMSGQLGADAGNEATDTPVRAVAVSAVSGKVVKAASAASSPAPLKASVGDYRVLHAEVGQGFEMESVSVTRIACSPKLLRVGDTATCNVYFAKPVEVNTGFVPFTSLGDAIEVPIDIWAGPGVRDIVFPIRLNSLPSGDVRKALVGVRDDHQSLVFTSIDLQ